MRPVEEIITEIESYESNDGNWLRLDNTFVLKLKDGQKIKETFFTD